MQENAQRKLEADREEEQISNPEADAFFNSIVEQYRQGINAEPAKTRDSSSHVAPTARLQDPAPEIPASSSVTVPPAGQRSAPTAPERAAADFVLCSGCGSSMPAVNRLCYVCGTLRDEPERSDVRVATPAPELAVNKRKPEPWPRSIDPQPAPVAAPVPEPPPAPASTAALFEMHYRPNTVAPEEQVEEKRRSYAPLVAAALLVLLIACAVAMGWKSRHSASNLLANIQKTFDAEFAQVWGSTPAATVLPPAPVAAQRPHVVHEARRYSTGKRAVQVPPPEPAALRVNVEGQPGASTASPYSQPATVTTYSPANVHVALEPTPPLIVHISPRESLDLVVKQVSPEYPDEARAARVQGSVVLKALVTSDGRVAHLDVVSGAELLIPAAVSAVRQWLYRPYVIEGVPQEFETIIVVDFSLANTTARALP